MVKSYQDLILSCIVQADIGVRINYDDFIQAGLSYRTGDAIVLLSSVRFMEDFQVIYSYGIITSGLRNASSGSHEFTLSYDIHDTPVYGRNKRRYKLNRVKAE